MSQGGVQRPLVLILGAGLSGLTLANLLDPERVEVLILEQDFPPGRSQEFHGIVRTPDLTALGLDTTNLPLHPIRHVVHNHPRRGDPPWSPGEPIVVAGWHSIEHRDLLDALRDRARSLGATIVANQSEVDLIWRQGELNGVRTRPGGLTFEADLVVFADESDPRLPEQLGLRPDWLPTELMHLAKLRFDGSTSEASQIRAFSQPASWGSPGHGLVVPGEDAVTVKVAMLLEDAMASERHISEYLDEILLHQEVRTAIEGLDRGQFVTEVVPVGGFGRRHRFQQGKAMVANDLIGVTHPLNRDGFSTTFDICRIAAATSHESVAHGQISDHRLDRYCDRVDEAFPIAARARRRKSRSLAERPAWQWFSLAELTPAAGVTTTANSAKLPAAIGGRLRRHLRRRLVR